jgi:hypothetical protein
MSEVSSNGLTAYNWTDYDKKIKPSNLKGKMEEALSDNKLTGTEIDNLKKDFESQGVSEEEFYSSLSSVTGVNTDKLKSANNSPVEFSFNIQNNKVSAIVEDKNEDGDSEVATTKEGGSDAVVFSPNAKTPENLKFKDYKTNNFNEVTTTDKKSDFTVIPGRVATIKSDKVADAISEDKNIPH